MFGLSDDKQDDKPADNFQHTIDGDEHGAQSYSDDRQTSDNNGPQTPAQSFWSDPVSSDDDQKPTSDQPAQTDDHVSVDSPAQASSTGGDDLLNLKQHALQDLAPLVGHLDQTPEERFKTTMMLIQASDNSSLVHEAYEAANKIQDEKARAQALLDVVNEINYFTHQKPEND